MLKPKKKPALLVMAAVLLPGLIISLLGIYFVSQQKRARELNTLKELNARMTHIRGRIETETLNAIEIAFKRASEAGIDFTNPNAVINDTKTILLGNPIVKYPFFINSGGNYLFPFSKKTVFPEVLPPYRQAVGRVRQNDYIKAENLEFKKRKFVEAITLYLKCLPVDAYVYNAIGRCYFKLGRYRQAVVYYERVLRRFPQLLKRDRSLHFQVLRQTALAHKTMGNGGSALARYLDLYENILDYQLSGKPDTFEFFKNEALDYLNRRARRDGRESDRFNRARGKDKLEKASQLDISLGWRYFESDSADSADTADVTSERDTLRFLKLRELYTANDEKTAFYKAAKALDEWDDGPPSQKITQVKIPPGNIPVDISIKKIVETKNIFFGFMISFEFIQRDIVAGAEAELPGDGSLKLALADIGDTFPHRLVTLPLARISPAKQLVLYSSRDNYIRWVVEKEIRLLYGLILALVVALFLGFYIMYKYISREAELVRLKADFVDGVSHTLKTPLTRLALMAENIEQGWVTDENQKKAFLNTIIRETTFMNEMIDNMLDFSRIEAGKKEYSFQIDSLQEIIRTVVKRHSDILEKNGFQLEVKLEKNVPLLEVDRDAVTLMAANLIQNAVKYSPDEKYLAVRVFLEGTSAVLEVEDRGIGIPEADFGNIFKKFYRASDMNGTVRSREGSGLGLFIAGHAAAAHNGAIHVKSETGKGSTFRVKLPMKGVK